MTSNWWKRYHNHIYGLASVIGVPLAVVLFFLSARTSVETDPTTVDTVAAIESELRSQGESDLHTTAAIARIERELKTQNGSLRDLVLRGQEGGRDVATALDRIEAISEQLNSILRNLEPDSPPPEPIIASARALVEESRGTEWHLSEILMEHISETPALEGVRVTAARLRTDGVLVLDGTVSSRKQLPNVEARVKELIEDMIASDVLVVPVPLSNGLAVTAARMNVTAPANSGVRKKPWSAQSEGLSLTLTSGQSTNS